MPSQDHCSVRRNTRSVNSEEHTHVAWFPSFPPLKTSPKQSPSCFEAQRRSSDTCGAEELWLQLIRAPLRAERQVRAQHAMHEASWWVGLEECLGIVGHQVQGLGLGFRV